MEPRLFAQGLIRRVVASNGKPQPGTRVIAIRFIGRIALPSNHGMQLTIKSVTPFAFAKAAPLLLAADPRC